MHAFAQPLLMTTTRERPPDACSLAFETSTGAATALLVVNTAALDRHLLINRTSDTVVRLLPPYVITEREIDEALPLLEAAIATVVEAPRS